MNRMEFILRNVLVLCFLLGMQVGRGQVRVAGVDAADDVDTYFAHIEGTHPNPYWHTPRAEVEHFRDSVKALCLGQDSVDVGELSYWLAQGNHFFDYHTACDIEVKGVKEAVFFPCLAFEGERILWEGKEVKSVGGCAVGDILQAIKRCMGADMPWGTCCYELNHWTLGQKVMLYMGLRPPFAVQFADGTETTVAGYTYADLQQMYNEETREDYSFEMYELDSIAIIRFNRYIMGGFQDFRMFLQRSFDLIQKRGVRYLFIDVSVNPGGMSTSMMPFLSYINPEGRRGKFSQWGRVMNEKGRFETERSNMIWYRSPEKFQGTVFIYQSYATRSSGPFLGEVLRSNGAAVLVGTETEATMPAYSNAAWRLLPFSGLSVSSSRDYYYRERPALRRDEMGCLLPDIEYPFVNLGVEDCRKIVELYKTGSI